jgi:hypothetical protein
MKVKELIEILQKLDPELLVVVRGYEGGVDEVNNIYLCNVELDSNAGIEYYGKHEILYDEEKPWRENGIVVKAVQLRGGLREDRQKTE